MIVQTRHDHGVKLLKGDRFTFHDRFYSERYCMYGFDIIVGYLYLFQSIQQPHRLDSGVLEAEVSPSTWLAGLGWAAG